MKYIILYYHRSKHQTGIFNLILYPQPLQSIEFIMLQKGHLSVHTNKMLTSVTF